MFNLIFKLCFIEHLIVLVLVVVVLVLVIFQLSIKPTRPKLGYSLARSGFGNLLIHPVWLPLS